MSEQNISLQRQINVGLNLIKKDGVYDDTQAYDYVVDKYLGRTKLAIDIVDQLEKNIQNNPNARILDEASGTGAISLELARRGFKTVSTDISDEMLNKLKSKSDEEGLKIITAIANSNQNLPFADNSFSAVLTASANRYITDMDVFLDEVNRVLTPGGIFIWPILGADIIPWKINSGVEQPTLSHNLAKKMEDHGFNVKSDTIGSMFRNSLKGVPIYAIPTYLVGQKTI